MRSIIWSRTGNHGSDWNVARVTVNRGSGRRITFEGVRGDGFSGDVALDDIKMITGSCPPPGRLPFQRIYLSKWHSKVFICCNFLRLAATDSRLLKVYLDTSNFLWLAAFARNMLRLFSIHINSSTFDYCDRLRLPVTSANTNGVC